MQYPEDTRTLRRAWLPLSLIAAAACSLSSCATSGSGSGSSAQLDAKTDATLTAMSEKLSAAKTLRVTGTRTASAGVEAPVKMATSAQGTIVVQRPDVMVARMKTNEGARTIGLSSGNVTLVDNKPGTHATVKAKGDIDQTLREIEDTYGIRPPAAELLVNHPRQFLLDGVKSGRFVGAEKISGVACEHLAFTQEGMTWDLWVASGDKLPRRISMTYPNGQGGKPLTVTANLTHWELGAPLSAQEVTVAVPKNSRAIDMVPLGN